MEKNSKILVLGHKGMVGSSIVRELKKQNYNNVFTDTNKPRVDLTDQQQTLQFIEYLKPDYIYLAAAKVGGIYANSTYPAQFIYNNLAIQCNVIEASRIHNVKKLLFLGSTCIYPKEAPQPLKEEYLLSGPLEPTNEYYAIAKIAGIKMCEAYHKEYGCCFISCQPTNLYGINDNYDPMNSHVIPALIRKFHEAKINKDKEVIIWGTGVPKREFLFADDLAKACIFLMKNYSDKELINIGSEKEYTIREIAQKIKQVVGFNGSLSFDPSKPDGTLRKLTDSSKIKSMGWKPETELEEGLKISYEDFVKNRI
ncbi:MAG: GDP-L-fucose synthase family protein [Bacillota bacterium]